MDFLIKNIGKFGVGGHSYSIEQNATDDWILSVIGGELLIGTYNVTKKPNFVHITAYGDYNAICFFSFDRFKTGHVLTDRRASDVIYYVNTRLKESDSDLEWTREDDKFILRRIRKEEVEQAQKRVKIAEECVELFQAELEEKITELKKAKAELKKLLPL